MRIISGAIRNPVAIGVTVLLISLFGLLALKQLPLQLFPDIERPTISIFTNWRGASPEEVEAELLEPQEQVLQGLAGLEEVNGNANSGGSQVFLTFAIGTDMKSALVEVIGRMSRLPPLPRDADRPFVQLGGGDGGGSNEQLSFFFVQLLPGTEGPIERHRRLVDDVVKPRIESVPGVAQVEVQGGPPDDVRITLDLARAAALGIGIPDIARQAASATNVSAGQLDVGRRQYSLRYTGRYDAKDLGQLVLAWRDGQPVRLADLATVEMTPPDRQFFSYQNGNPAIGLRIIRAPGANVLSTLEEVKSVVAELRDGPLKERGLGIEQSFDASLFIKRAVNLLIENLVVGALLALACVWWFMRDARATVLIASTIPVCLLATFCVLAARGSQHQRHLAGRPRVCRRHGRRRRDRRLRQHHPIERRRHADRPGRERRHATGRARVVRFDGDDDCGVPAGAVPQGRRRTDLRRPRSDDLHRGRVLDRGRDHGRSRSGRTLARRAFEELRLRRGLAAADRLGDRMDAHA